MGLSIHYSGQIKAYPLIENLVNEATDICKSLNWKYHKWLKSGYANDDAYKKNPDFLNYSLDDLAGITLFPNKCEPISLVFFPCGKLCFPEKLIYNDPVSNDLMVEIVSAKTQYAGIDIHLSVLKLLQYFKDKYFIVFELQDEGMYWETKDEEILRSQFIKYNFIVNSVTDTLSDFEQGPGIRLNHWQTGWKYS